MKCIYCDSSIFENNNEEGQPITVQGKGISHTMCHSRDLINQRIFKGLPVNSLDFEELSELRDMVLIEINSRLPSLCDEIELF
jgi:hypothetical protein